MPFTIGGEWVPGKNSKESIKPVKVRLVKRGKSTLTVILNLNMDDSEKQELAIQLKRKLGCGGTVKEGAIEIQGDKAEPVKKHLLAIGIKSS